MRRITAIALMATLVFAVHSGAAPLPDELPNANKALRGHVLFRTHACVQCHAIAGKGGSGGPDLGRMTVWASPLIGAAVMWNHVELMERAMTERGLSWPDFQIGDIADIFAYLHSLNPQKESVHLCPEEPLLGRENYIDTGCGTCHGEPFRGGRIGPDLGETASRTDNAEAFAGRMMRHATTMTARPPMAAMAKEGIFPYPRLTGNQIANIFAYLKRHLTSGRE